LVLILDDLQWADTTSIALLFHMGRQLEGGSILIAGAYRPVEVALGRGGDRHPLEQVLVLRGQLVTRTGSVISPSHPAVQSHRKAQT
jgi:hypothetical protein